MKKYLILIPITLIVLSIIGFFINKNTEIHKAEKELTHLKELSYELKDMFLEHTKLINDREKVDAREITISTKNLNFAIDNYLNTLNSSNYDRLFRISKIIKEKQTNLTSLYENIKQDRIKMKNSILASIKSYEKYMEHKRSVSASDRNFMIYLFKSTLHKSYKEVIRLNATQNVAELNENIKTLQKTQQRLTKLEENIKKNSIIEEINTVILFSFQTSESLREETDSIVAKLFIGSTVLLIFSLIIYAKEIKSLAEMKKLKSELTEYVYALDNSAIISKTDLKGNITFVNDKFCDISGFEREELIGKPHNIVRHPDMDSSVFEELWDSIKYGDIFQGTIKNLSKDGSVYYVDTTVIPLHDENGKIDEYLSIRHDVTQFMTSAS